LGIIKVFGSKTKLEGPRFRKVGFLKAPEFFFGTRDLARFRLSRALTFWNFLRKEGTHGEEFNFLVYPVRNLAN